VLGLARGGPKDGVSAAVRVAARDGGAHRLVVLSSAGVHTEHDPGLVSGLAMVALFKLAAGPVLADAERAYRELQANGGDREWVFVRAPRLTERPRTGVYRTGYLHLDPRQSISRAEVADFMLRELTNDAYARRAPIASY